MSENILKGEKRGNIFIITFDRPEKRNALPFETLYHLSELVEEQINDRDVRVIILKGEGKVFSAGVDFTSLASLAGRYMGDNSAGGSLIRSDISKFQHYLNRLETIEIPIICAMHGGAFGMAMEVALACDIRMMSEDCLWGLQELQFGLIADLGGTARLSKLIGPSRAFEVLATGDRFSAQNALEWGLINHIFPYKSLFEEAEKLAGRILKMGPLAVGSVKRVIKKGNGIDLMTHLDMESSFQSFLLNSDDFREGVSALMEKREPNWSGR